MSKAEFRVNSQKYWYGTSLSFSRNQSTYFYKTIKGKGLDWEILDFDNTNLSRIDLYYDRKFKKGDEIENFDSFQCRSQIEKTDKRKIVIVDKGVLRVGRRGSGNYFRVYRRPNGKDIRFELELRKSVVKNFEFYLFSNQFEKLEELLCIHFYKQALTTFMMDSSYTDWLRESFRKIRSTQTYDNCLIATYLNTIPLETLEKQKFLYQLLQGEMNGYYYYSNAIREDYGNGIYGLDFKVIGQGEYSHVTHVEVKNPVGSDLEKASRNGCSDIVKQGNKLGDKLSKQQAKWSKATFRASLSNLNPNAVFPQSPANNLGLVDESQSLKK